MVDYTLRLIPLATSTMAQPVGSVLGFDPMFKTYLRSSPIFCAIDTLVAVLEIFRHRMFYEDTFRTAVHRVVERRYQGISHGAESFATTKGGAVLRWVFFAIGTYNAILKLAGARGIPWTQTWAFAYVVSFIIFECILVLVPTSAVVHRTGQYGGHSTISSA